MLLIEAPVLSVNLSDVDWRNFRIIRVTQIFHSVTPLKTNHHNVIYTGTICLYVTWIMNIVSVLRDGFRISPVYIWYINAMLQF